MSDWLAIPASGNPTGSVTFYDGSNSLGNCNLSGDGSASFSIGNLGVGSHNISFTYSGDDNDSGSTSDVVTQTVNAVNTITSISSSINTSVFGQSVTFTASVTPSSATGTVTFKDGSKTLGTATLSGGSATFSINSLAVGSHSITAVYGGDTYDNGSTSSSITETVWPNLLLPQHRCRTEQRMLITTRLYRFPVDRLPLHGQ